jgi:hypothetical protein
MSSYKGRQNLEKDIITSFDDNENLFLVHRVQSSLQRNNIVGAVNILCFAFKGVAKKHLASDGQNENYCRKEQWRVIASDRRSEECNGLRFDNIPFMGAQRKLA